MRLWKIYQEVNQGYDTYDSAVVVAPNIEAAKAIHPSGRNVSWKAVYPTWARSPEQVGATEIGVAADNLEPGTIICASFNAG